MCNTTSDSSCDIAELIDRGDSDIRKGQGNGMQSEIIYCDLAWAEKEICAPIVNVCFSVLMCLSLNADSCMIMLTKRVFNLHAEFSFTFSVSKKEVAMFCRLFKPKSSLWVRLLICFAQRLCLWFHLFA